MVKLVENQPFWWSMLVNRRSCYLLLSHNHNHYSYRLLQLIRHTSRSYRAGSPTADAESVTSCRFCRCTAATPRSAQEVVTIARCADGLHVFLWESDQLNSRNRIEPILWTLSFKELVGSFDLPSPCRKVMWKKRLFLGCFAWKMGILLEPTEGWFSCDPSLDWLVLMCPNCRSVGLCSSERPNSMFAAWSQWCENQGCTRAGTLMLLIAAVVGMRWLLDVVGICFFYLSCLSSLSSSLTSCFYLTEVILEVDSGWSIESNRIKTSSLSYLSSCLIPIWQTNHAFMRAKCRQHFFIGRSGYWELTN